MPRKPKNPPTSYDDMFNEQLEKRQSKIYKEKSLELRSGELSALANRLNKEIANTDNRLDITNLDQVKVQTNKFFTACAATGTLPSFLGLCRAFGYSSQRVYKTMETRPDSEVTEYLQIVRDAISDGLDAAALGNNVNSIVAIFIQKSVHSRREGIELIAVQPVNLLSTSGDIDGARAYADRLRLLDGAVNNDE